jgi:hypothetical protein
MNEMRVLLFAMMLGLMSRAERETEAVLSQLDGAPLGMLM